MKVLTEVESIAESRDLPSIDLDDTAYVIFTSGSTGAASGTTSASGTGATSSNNPPYLVVNYIIKY